MQLLTVYGSKISRDFFILANVLSNRVVNQLKQEGNKIDRSTANLQHITPH